MFRHPQPPALWVMKANGKKKRKLIRCTRQIQNIKVV